jgi:Holliday junction DNA helicase RuvA
MIASLRGRVLEIDQDSAVVEIGGVGLEVYLPAPLKDRMRPGENVFFYTTLVVREDSLTLYGFDSQDTRELFELLMGVNGIGPRLALSILSTLVPETIRRAIFHEQPEVFSRVPGVGHKTSQKILLHLQDRIKVHAGLEGVAAVSDLDTDVLEALTALGYSVVEAQSAIQSIPRDAPEDLEARLVIALQYFTKP